MTVKEMTVSYARKVSTGPYENADIMFSETIEVGPSTDPERVAEIVYKGLKAMVDRWTEDLRA